MTKRIWNYLNVKSEIVFWEGRKWQASCYFTLLDCDEIVSKLLYSISKPIDQLFKTGQSCLKLRYLYSDCEVYCFNHSESFSFS